ncbi:MAG: hypothetical protein V2A63_03135 [Patescibacteria group bacterium]
MIPNSNRSQSETLKNTRETLVIELNTDPVGVDEAGDEKIKQYLRVVARILGAELVCEPQTNLSPKYGFSGWLPCKSPEGPFAIHLYIWDDRDPSFVSVDISAPTELLKTQEEALKNHAFQFFGGKEMIIKTSRDQSDWRDIAPDKEIIRQRLALRSAVEKLLQRSSREAQIEEVRHYSQSLCTDLKMDKISEPVVVEEDGLVVGWMHWETSGVITVWTSGQFYCDIYTCKKFNPKIAIKLTRAKIGEVLESYNF